ncbi:DUF1611 domain-containing protein, partial [Arthrospira platensis SPKY1]|nr:DUF1611 domain-containing protein [Arthrospira platensis SPKY1]
QIQAIELISGRKVIALTLNHENMTAEEIPQACKELSAQTGLPCFDVLHDGPEGLVDLLEKLI